MQIKNLPYIETISEEDVIAGAFRTGVIAIAAAQGHSTLAKTTVHSTARTLSKNGSLSISRGFAFAKGEDPYAQVITAGDGDIVVGSTHSTPDISLKPVDVSHGVVVAIDLPRS